MNIKKISLLNFRNYVNENIEFNENINILYGDNARGKTNIIEWIFISAFGKSFRAKKDNELIKIGQENTKVIIEYQKKDRNGKIEIILNKKKEILINGVKIKKLSEILGIVNIVLFTPDDINILKNGPSRRRRFLDMMIGQLRPNYVYLLNLYLKTLEQRNIYLRQIQNNDINNNMLDIWDEKIVEYGKKVYEYRLEFINKIISKINKIHSKITEEKEVIRIEYKSDIKDKDKFLEELKQDRKKDILRGFTSRGIHRDDFMIYINDKLVNIYGSQGQNRTVILSLKLTELEIIKEEIDENPILLLDDFMSELDEKRRQNFLNNISNTQVIITCTEKININEKAKIFYINNGTIEKE